MNYIFIVLWIIQLGAISGSSTDRCGRLIRHNKDISSLQNNGAFELRTKRKRSEEILCPGLCEPKNMPPCFCDALCHIFNDCCLENNSKLLPSLGIQSEASCEIYSTLQNRLIKPFGVVVMKNCLKKYASSSMADKCSKATNSTDLLQMIPVTDKIGLTFTNVYCALCNDVHDVSPWDLAAILSNQPVLSVKNLSEMLQILSKPMGVVPVPENPLKPRVCIRYTNRKNLSHSEDQCGKYVEPILYSGDIFRNRHCIPKDIIENCNPAMGQNDCKHICIKGINTSMTDYNFERNPRFNSILVKFGRHLRLEYDSRQCTPEELLLGSKVQCVHLGCINGGNTPCKMYEVNYNHFKLQLKWYVRTDSTASPALFAKCTNMILNILSFSKIVSVVDLNFIKLHEEKDCDVILIYSDLSYVGILPIANAVPLQTWLSKVHFTYTEVKGNTTSVIQRIYPGHKDLSDTPHHTTCIRVRKSIKVAKTEDKESMVSALARYPLPIPIYKCSYINMTVSVEELTDRTGKSYRNYKVMEVFCAQNVSVLITGRHMLVLICLFTVLKYI